MNDIKLAKEAQELLDRQDRQRADFFKNLREKQERLLAGYAEGVGNELERKAKEDAERAE